MSATLEIEGENQLRFFNRILSSYVAMNKQMFQIDLHKSYDTTEYGEMEDFHARYILIDPFLKALFNDHMCKDKFEAIRGVENNAMEVCKLYRDNHRAMAFAVNIFNNQTRTYH